MSDDLNFVQRARRDKLAAIEALGVAPFAYSFDRTHSAAEVLAAAPEGTEEGEVVSVAGRLVAWRGHGKTIFAHLADLSGRIQLYFRRDHLGDATFALLEQLDIGDLVGVTGPIFRTRTGETTVKADAVTLLAKSLRALPLGKEEVIDGETVRHAALTDSEQRSRQRYADLAVHPEARALFIARTRLVSAIREYLDGLGYLEVETPSLQPLYGGAAARPFTTIHNALDMQLYLRIADELYLKRLIVGGMERVYEIGHDFRNEGIDRTHNPEFTMLEFYEAYADYTTMMARVEQLLVRAAAAVRATPELAPNVPVLEPPFARVSWSDSLTAALGADAIAMNESELRSAAKRHSQDLVRGDLAVVEEGGELAAADGVRAMETLRTGRAHC